jgi:hypothetical protein
VTTSEALAIAAQAKPIRRQSLDKLQGSSMAAAADALAKRYDAMGGTVTDIQKQIGRAQAAVEFVRDFRPDQPVRKFNS